MSDNRIPIPGRMRVVDVDGIGLGADEILDDTLQMKQSDINAIVLGGAINVNLAASLATVFAGTAIAISLTASSSTPANTITIKKGDTTLATGSGTSLPGSDTLIPVEGDNVYTAQFLIGGLTKNASKNVVGVLPVSYGALASYDAAGLTPLQAAVTKVAGQYTMTLDSTRRYIYFKVPKRNVTGITSVGMGSGAEISPVAGGYVAALEDADYRVWKSNDGFTGNGNQIFTVN